MSHVALGGVKGCTKPNCGLRAPLNRHHRAHQALWIGVWAWRHGEKRFRSFIQRYHEFRSEDTVLICQDHHAEIHMIYDSIIASDVVGRGKPLSQYSWKQARILMEKLEIACSEWLLLETGGIDSRVYEKLKKMHRGLAKARAKRKKSRG
jgi:hypothetical protein